MRSYDMKKTTAVKLKTAGIIIGVTTVVCVVIKYMLPLVAPFVFALIIACIIDRPVTYMASHMHIKRIIGATVMVIVVTAIPAAALIYGCRAVMGQINRLTENFTQYSEQAMDMVRECCDTVDNGLELRDGTSYEMVSAQLDNVGGIISDRLIPAVMNGSWSVISTCAVFFTATAFTIMAAVFISRDMRKIKLQCDSSVFGAELEFLAGRLKNILGTYVKTQLIIMTLTCIICTAGLYFMGNPYALLLGIIIGLVDALPVLGTGTVFVPWCVIMLLMGRYGSAAALFVIYMISYYTREFLEPKLMGEGLGISPVLMLISLYAGLLLFGITGVITGPIAAILIREICARLIKKLA